MIIMHDRICEVQLKLHLKGNLLIYLKSLGKEQKREHNLEKKLMK